MSWIARDVRRGFSRHYVVGVLMLLYGGYRDRWRTAMTLHETVQVMQIVMGATLSMVFVAIANVSSCSGGELGVEA